MRRSLYTASLLSALMLSFFMAATLQAEEGFGKDKMFDEKGWEEKINKMYDKLDLNEEQRAQLKAQKDSHRGEAKGLREQLRAKREEFSQEIQKPDFDAGKLKAINDDIKSLHNQIADQRLESILKVREILTPEQFAKFMAMKEEHKGQWRDKIKEKRKEHRDLPK